MTTMRRFISNNVELGYYPTTNVILGWRWGGDRAYSHWDLLVGARVYLPRGIGSYYKDRYYW